MNRKLALLTAAALALPILLRLSWFFPGISFPRAISTPDYLSLKMPAAPISTPQTWQVKITGGEVVIDYAHSNQFQPNEIQALADDLAERGARVVMDSDPDVLATTLKAANAYVVISPAAPFSSSELQLVHDFVGRGGRLVVFTDATRGVPLYDYFGNPSGTTPDVNSVNPLLEPFGITVNADYLYNLDTNDGNFRNVYLNVAPPSGLTDAVQKVVFYGTHSIEVDSGAAILVGDHKTLSSLTDATPGSDPQKVWSAAVLSSDGNVLALGDFTFLTPPYDTVADNAPLIHNLAEFMLNGRRKVSLADYPFVFPGDEVDILLTSDVQMTAEMIGALARLQSGLQASGIKSTVVQDEPGSSNLIVLGTFSLNDDVKKYIRPFGVTAEGFSDFIELPQLGKLGKSGTGLVLFSPGSKYGTLTLMANSVDDLTTLMDTIGTGGLSSCLLQENVGACSIGFGGSFSESTPTPAGTTTLPAP